MHVGARYYDPSTGRFLQRDPIGIAGGLNVYAYVGNRPTVRIDPLGLYDEPNDPPVGPSGSDANPNNRPNNPLADSFLSATGGRDSWLDDPAKVRKARQWLRAPAIACAVVFLPHGPAVKIIVGTGAAIANSLAP